MNFKTTFLNNLASKWLKKTEQVEALKKLGERSDWKSLAKKCHDKISGDYRFWVTKKDSPQRSAKLTDITRDVAFMNLIESKEKLDKVQLEKLKEISKKYGVN